MTGLKYTVGVKLQASNDSERLWNCKNMKKIDKEIT